MDYLMICGRYQLRPALPYVPGTDAAGVIVAVGDKVERFRCGDRVACANWFGGFAERMVAKASKSARIPDNVDFAVGSTVLHAYLTAWYALVDRARLKPGETVLITGAGGGVGLACVEVASLLGGRVIAAVGSASKAEVARDMGAEHVVDYGSEDIRERVKSLTGGEGVDLAVDNVGGTLFLTLARLMRWNGRLIPIGFAGGEIPSLPMNLPLLKNYSVVGVFAGAWTTNFPEEAAEAADRIMAFVGEGRLNPHIDRLLPLEEAAEAMRAVAERNVRGRIVLKVR
jgi:NADPH:quinone reductase